MITFLIWLWPSQIQYRQPILYLDFHIRCWINPRLSRPYLDQNLLRRWYIFFLSYIYMFSCSVSVRTSFNTLRPRPNGRHFPDDIFKSVLLNENVQISIKISLKFVPKGPISNIPSLVQIMDWRRSCDKPLSEPMMISLLTHICVVWPQWVNIMPEICPSICMIGQSSDYIVLFPR